MSSKFDGENTFQIRMVISQNISTPSTLTSISLSVSHICFFFLYSRSSTFTFLICSFVCFYYILAPQYLLFSSVRSSVFNIFSLFQHLLLSSVRSSVFFLHSRSTVFTFLLCSFVCFNFISYIFLSVSRIH